MNIMEHRSSTLESTPVAMYCILFTYGLATFIVLHIVTIRFDIHILRRCIKFLFIMYRNLNSWFSLHLMAGFFVLSHCLCYH